jgi:hypothetical protein
MTKDEALKLALEALTYKKWFRIGMVEQNDPRVEAAITAIKEALAQPAQEPDVEPACPVCHATPIFSLDRRVHEWSGQCKHCGVEGSPATTEAEAKQKWIVWHHKRSDTTPQQQEPRNFCPRCGKRTADLTVIHTCTPPEGGHQ